VRGDRAVRSLDLIGPGWLFNPSGEPHLPDIKRVKRVFDIVCSIGGGVSESCSFAGP
jgi:hypothetical protein